MKVSENLFELIKSLNKSEKGYFKKFTSMHVRGEQNNYSRLFDAIDRQDKYDEKKLMEIFKGEPLVNQFWVAKNYLYNQVLKSLHVYHLNTSADSKLKEMLHCSEILFDKQLYTQCEKVLDHAKKVADQHERFISLIEIYRRKRQLMSVRSYSGKTEKDLRAFIEEEKSLFKKINNITDYMNLSAFLYSKIHKKGPVRNPNEMKDIEKMVDNPLLKKESAALSFEAKSFYLDIHGIYFHTKGDWLQAYTYTRKKFELIENILTDNKEPRIIRWYVISLRNLLLYCITNKKVNEFYFYLQKLRSIPGKLENKNNAEIRNDIFFSSYNLECQLYITIGEFEKGIGLINVAERGLHRYKDANKTRVRLFYFNTACLYFGASHFDKALASLNKVLNDSKIDLREDVYCMAKILNLIIHYELGNTDLLEYAVKSTYRYLSQKNRLYKFETIILDYIRKKMPKIKSKQDLIIALSDLKNQLLKTFENTFEKNILRYFDFISWLESKIQNRSFAEIVQKKTKANTQ